MNMTDQIRKETDNWFRVLQPQLDNCENVADVTIRLMILNVLSRKLLKESKRALPEIYDNLQKFEEVIDKTVNVGVMYIATNKNAKDTD